MSRFIKLLCFLCVVLWSIQVHARGSYIEDNLKSIDKFKETEKSKNYVVKNKNIIIDIDFMEGLEFTQPASQIVLGNPIIADITVRDDKFIFISGKSPGRTNMLVYGRDGNLFEQYIVVVRDPNAYLTVYHGAANKAHFDCEPLCQRVLRIEDTGEAAEAQRGKIAAQIEMIDGRARQSKSEETQEQQEQTGR